MYAPPPLACPVPAARAALHKALGHAAGGTRANSWTLELRPQRRPPHRPLPFSPRWPWLPESRSRCRGAGEEGGKGRPRLRAGSGAAGPRWPACCAPTAAGTPGHAGALGPRGSMKGGDRAYTRGPSLGWLLAKCCCCFPCRGEWLSVLRLLFRQRPGKLSMGWRGGGE